MFSLILILFFSISNCNIINNNDNSCNAEKLEFTQNIDKLTFNIDRNTLCRTDNIKELNCIGGNAIEEKNNVLNITCTLKNNFNYCCCIENNKGDKYKIRDYYITCDFLKIFHYNVTNTRTCALFYYLDYDINIKSDEQFRYSDLKYNQSFFNDQAKKLFQERMIQILKEKFKPTVLKHFNMMMEMILDFYIEMMIIMFEVIMLI